jgi:hypothetical protein
MRSRTTSWTRVVAVMGTVTLGAAGSLALVGCVIPDPEPLTADAPNATAPLGVDEASLLSMLPSYTRSPAFSRLNVTPYATALPGGARVNVWVSMNAYAAYAGIAPEVDASGIVAPEGTLVVREVLDDAGAIAKLTLMYKGPAGYNPAVGDYWFGVTDASGAPEKMGKLEECYGCHQDRADDGYLFGVRRDVR